MGHAQRRYSNSQLDPGIEDAVYLLTDHGFETFESCEGGPGHCFPEPTVRFYGDEYDAIRAYDICVAHGMLVNCVRRVFQKSDVDPSRKKDQYPHGYVWDRPFNEIVFLKHADTGTIYRPR